MKKGKLKKRLAYGLLIFVVLSIINFIWSDNELTKIMGKSTELVDASRMVKKVESITLQNVNILSENCSEFIPNQDVILKNGKIVSISQTRDSIKPMSSNKVIDGKGKYLIPGLVDSHVHLKESKNDLLLYLVNGVTYIREMAGRPMTLDWKKSIEKNGLGPRLYLTSPSIYSESGLTGYYYEWTRKAINYSNRKDARKAIKKIKEDGYDAIKMYGTVNPEMFSATIEFAKEYDIPVIGHIPYVDLETFYPSGQIEIAHIEELTKKTMYDSGIDIYENPDKYLLYLNENADNIAKEVAKNDIVVTTTMWLMESIVDQSVNLESFLKTIELKYVNPKIAEGTILHKLGWLPNRNGYQRKGFEDDKELYNKEVKFWNTYAEAVHIMTKALLKHKVKVMAGTDANVAGVVPGFSLHDEIESMTKNCGMTNSQALYSTTVAPNEWMKSNSGKIKLGYNSDLVLLSKNPLENIKNTKTIEYVFFNNHIINKAQIKAILNAIENANNKDRSKDISEFMN